jgi:hypothetical protein
MSSLCPQHCGPFTAVQVALDQSIYRPLAPLSPSLPSPMMRRPLSNGGARLTSLSASLRPKSQHAQGFVEFLFLNRAMSVHLIRSTVKQLHLPSIFANCLLSLIAPIKGQRSLYCRNSAYGRWLHNEPRWISRFGQDKIVVHTIRFKGLARKAFRGVMHLNVRVRLR